MTTNQLPPRPSRSLAGKVVIVTGAGSSGDGLGNGRAIAILLAEDGAALLCVDRDMASAQRTADMANAEAKGRAVAFQADVTSSEQCAAMVDRAVGEFGRLDILVNNVGVLGPAGSAIDTDEAEWARGMEVNVTSMMLASKHALPAMLRNERGDQGIRGSIVHMGSVTGLMGWSGSLLYPVSKGAVVQMTRAMAAHHGKDGIRVNTVCPGMVYTPMVSTTGMTPEHREKRRQRSLLQTEGNAWDVAASVRFLAGGDARWITGSVLTVDAGASCAIEV